MADGSIEPEEDQEIRTTIVWADFKEHVIVTPYGLAAECSEGKIFGLGYRGVSDSLSRHWCENSRGGSTFS